MPQYFPFPVAAAKDTDPTALSRPCPWLRAQAQEGFSLDHMTSCEAGKCHSEYLNSLITFQLEYIQFVTVGSGP